MTGAHTLHTHETYMRKALDEARRAMENGEVPVGAVVVHDNMIIGKAHNEMEGLRDPTAHAEIIAIGAAAHHLKSWRLEATTLYCTLEPCPMCAGAIVQARIPLVVFGARDSKRGCCGSILDIVANPFFNHQAAVVPDVLAHECSEILNEFFRRIRKPESSRTGSPILRSLHDYSV
jgi:tRNA(adenine34) deaminase